MSRFYIKTYGCKVNQYESQLLSENIQRNGHILSRIEESDIIIVNTCCVTAKAESEARKFALKNLRGGKKVWITGCASRREKTTCRIDGAEIFPDNKNPGNFLTYLSDSITGFRGHTRAFVKIQDGCENFCAYCLVPYVRGPVKSRREQDIVCEIKTLVGKGYKEIVLTGVDLGAYGRDTGSCLSELIGKIHAIKDLKRLRLSSIEVFHLNRRLIETISGIGVLCPHFHIPLQSGSDRILGLMGRRYNAALFMESIEYLRSRIKGVTFTTDILVGFPGEGHEDFQETCRLVKEAGFLNVHVFRYSKREETPAYNLSGHVSEQTKKEREAELSALCSEIGDKVKSGFIGSMQKVLVERKCGEELHGYSENYIKSFFLSGKKLQNEIVAVKGEKIENGMLLCSIAG